MTQPVTPLSYQTPVARTGRPWQAFVGWKTLVGCYVVVFVLLLPMTLIVPRFESIFLDFNTKLPGLTQMVVDVSRWTTQDWGWLWLLALPAILGLLVGGVGAALRRATATPPTVQRRVLGWGFAFLITGFIVMAVVAILVIAMYLPMIYLVETVSGP